MVDWLVVAAALLAILCLLLGCAGCTATIDPAMSRGGAVVFLHVALFDPRPVRVMFSWEMDGEADSATVWDPLPRLLVIGETQFLVFQHTIEVPELSELTISCSVFTAGEEENEEQARGSASCDSFQASLLEWKNVTFVFDPDGEPQVTCVGVSD